MGTHPDLDFAGIDLAEDEEWTEPTLHGDTDDDFGVPDDTQWDELSEEQRREVMDNYLLPSEESFGANSLPVVDPEGDVDPSNDQLNENAVDNADARLGQVEGITPTKRATTQERIDDLQARIGGAER